MHIFWDLGLNTQHPGLNIRFYFKHVKQIHLNNSRCKFTSDNKLLVLYIFNVQLNYLTFYNRTSDIESNLCCTDQKLI